MVTSRFSWWRAESMFLVFAFLQAWPIMVCTSLSKQSNFCNQICYLIFKKLLEYNFFKSKLTSWNWSVHNPTSYSKTAPHCSVYSNTNNRKFPDQVKLLFVVLNLADISKLVPKLSLHVLFPSSFNDFWSPYHFRSLKNSNILSHLQNLFKSVKKSILYSI